MKPFLQVKFIHTTVFSKVYEIVLKEECLYKVKRNIPSGHDGRHGQSIKRFTIGLVAKCRMSTYSFGRHFSTDVDTQDMLHRIPIK